MVKIEQEPHKNIVYQVPAVFTIAGKDMFKICSENENALNQCFTSRWGYLLNRWVNVKIVQDRYFFIIPLLWCGGALKRPLFKTCGDPRLSAMALGELEF